MWKQYSHIWHWNKQKSFSLINKLCKYQICTWNKIWSHQVMPRTHSSICFILTVLFYSHFVQSFWRLFLHLFISFLWIGLFSIPHRAIFHPIKIFQSPVLVSSMLLLKMVETGAYIQDCSKKMKYAGWKQFWTSQKSRKRSVLYLSNKLTSDTLLPVKGVY